MKRSSSEIPTAARPSGSAAPRACASRWRGRGVGEQDDVCRAGRGVQVLFVLDRIPVSAQEQTTSVGARSSFAADSGPAASFSRSSARGPITGSATDW